MKEKYYPSLNTLRLVCILLLIPASFGLPFASFSYIQPILYFTQPMLFTLYGYILFRNGRVNYAGYIRKLLIVFVLMLVVYLPLSLQYRWLMGESLSSMFRKRRIFEFVVLNIWPSPPGAPIWMVQSSLYALIILAVLDKLRLLKYDRLLCVLLFVIAFLIGEGAGLIRFSFLGYSFIPGNFLTRALPYILLGKLLGERGERLAALPPFVLLLGIAVSVVLCYAELFGFSALGKLVYSTHLVGYIPLCASLLILLTQPGPIPEAMIIDRIHRNAGFVIYAVYSPAAYGLLLYAMKYRNEAVLNGVGLLTLVGCILIGFAAAFIGDEIKALRYRRRAMLEEETEDNDETEI